MTIEAPIKPDTETQETINHRKQRIIVCDPTVEKPFEELRERSVAEGKPIEIIYLHKLQDKSSVKIGEHDDILVLRSATKLTNEVIRNFHNPKGVKRIIRQGTGVDNIDLETATEFDIPVNAIPESNVNSVKELTKGFMINLARGIIPTSGLLKEGVWAKLENQGIELQGKTIGVIGVGRIGGAVAETAIKGFEMRAIGYDPVPNKEFAERIGLELTSLDRVLRESDVITIHTPLIKGQKGKGTYHLIGEEELAKVKKDAIIINTARGGIIDENALAQAIQEEKIRGAALDVVEDEKNINPILLASNKVIITPHIGAQTFEAQRRGAYMAAEIAEKAFKGEKIKAINFPDIPDEELRALEPYTKIVPSLASLAFLISPGQIGKIELEYLGNIASLDSRPLKAAVIKGIMSQTSETDVNLGNYERVAKQRGLDIKEYKDPAFTNSHLGLITIKMSYQDQETKREGQTTIKGTAGYNGAPEITEINGCPVNLKLLKGKYHLFIQNDDTIGRVDAVSDVIKEASININGMSVESNINGIDKAIMAFRLDGSLSENDLEQIRQIPGIHFAQLFSLSTLA